MVRHYKYTADVKLNEASLRVANMVNVVNQIFNECISRGFTEKDESIDYKELQRITREQNDFSNYMPVRLIYPVTFVAANKDKNVTACENEMEVVQRITQRPIPLCRKIQRNPQMVKTPL